MHVAAVAVVELVACMPAVAAVAVVELVAYMPAVAVVVVICAFVVDVAEEEVASMFVDVVEELVVWSLHSQLHAYWEVVEALGHRVLEVEVVEDLLYWWCRYDFQKE